MSIPNLKPLYNAVFDARAKWRFLLLQLNVDRSSIEALAVQWRENPDDCLYHGLSDWLDGGERSWRDVVDALSSPPVGCVDLASNIKRDYLQSTDIPASQLRNFSVNPSTDSVNNISHNVALTVPERQEDYGSDNSIEVDRAPARDSQVDLQSAINGGQHERPMEVDNQQVISKDLSMGVQKPLGTGAFGTVFKGMFRGFPCAVKMLNHVALGIRAGLPVGPGQTEAAKAFDRECDSLQMLRHPNVVEHLTTARHPTSRNNILVTELMDCSLSSYLPSSAGSLSTDGEISISKDIAMGLAYIHGKKFLHRDLCGDNVLLKLTQPIPLAKISDFGMSRLLDPAQMTHSLTGLGHRKAFLPPEAARLEDEEYNESLDIFSMGVTMIQIVSRAACIRDPRERERLLTQISELHPLRRIIIACLSDDRRARPEAKDAGLYLQALQKGGVRVENLETPLHHLSPPLSVEYKGRMEMPIGMSSFLQSVVIGDAIFFAGSAVVNNEGTYIILKYQRGQWSRPHVPYGTQMFAMTSLNNQLLLVGGISLDVNNPSEIVVLDKGQWTNPYSNSGITCWWSTTVTFNNCIIVVGGFEQHSNKPSLTVRVFVIALRAWFQIESLPKALHSMKSAVIRNTLYLMGGCDQNGGTKSVFKADLNMIVQNTPASPIWEQIEDCPLLYSTPLCIGGSLLAIGGSDHQGPSSSIFLYQPKNNSWVPAGDLPTPRSNCTCSVLPNDDIVVFGHGEDDVPGAAQVIDIISIIGRN